MSLIEDIKAQLGAVNADTTRDVMGPLSAAINELGSQIMVQHAVTSGTESDLLHRSLANLRHAREAMEEALGELAEAIEKNEAWINSN